MLDSLLHTLSLSPLHLTVILITAVASLLLIAVHKYQVFSPVQLQDSRLAASTIIYINHKGSYRNLHVAFSRIGKDAEGHFHISRLFGVFYDNPEHMPDQRMCRSTIGILVNEGEKHKVDEFMRQHYTYNLGRLPATTCKSAEHAYVNALSFMLIVSKVHPKLSQYLRAANKSPPIMQIYHFLSPTVKKVEVLAPLENQQAFYLWRDCKLGN